MGSSELPEVKYWNPLDYDQKDKLDTLAGTDKDGYVRSMMFLEDETGEPLMLRAETGRRHGSLNLFALDPLIQH